MRDILVSAIVFGALPFIVFWRPHLGVLMWVWISMMNPHRLSFGFAYNFPFAYIVAIATIVGLVLTRQRNTFPITPISGLMIGFLLWMSFTALFAMQPPDVVFGAWSRVVKTQLMIFVTLMLIRGRAQIDQLIWAIVLSVGFYGVKGGIWTVFHGGIGRVWGPPGSYIEGNNELALALVTLLPLIYYLAQTAAKRWVRFGLWFALAACSFSILGSQSRGALLALAAVTLFLGAKSTRPVLLTTVLVAGFVGAVAFMPDTWSTRMTTISTYDVDSSAMSRLQTWQTIWNLALHRPIVGAGFDLSNPALFQAYAENPNMPDFGAHSIYFQVLGEHGFVGLALYLVLGFAVWRRSSHLAMLAKGHPDLQWVPILMRSIQVSIVGFAVGGAFLGLLHYDLPYYFAAIVILVDVAVRNRGADAVRPAPRNTVSAEGIRSV